MSDDYSPRLEGLCALLRAVLEHWGAFTASHRREESSGALGLKGGGREAARQEGAEADSGEHWRRFQAAFGRAGAEVAEVWAHLPAEAAGAKLRAEFAGAVEPGPWSVQELIEELARFFAAWGPGVAATTAWGFADWAWRTDFPKAMDGPTTRGEPVAGGRFAYDFIAPLQRAIDAVRRDSACAAARQLAERLSAGPRGAVVGLDARCAGGGCDARPSTRPGGGPQRGTAAAAGSKRSTQPGEARAKLVAALTRHHHYQDGGCLNLAPIGNNELARLAEVSESSASGFFRSAFGGHAKYRRFCTDSRLLVGALRMLNGEISPQWLSLDDPESRVPEAIDRGDSDE